MIGKPSLRHKVGIRIVFETAVLNILTDQDKRRIRKTQAGLNELAIFD